MRAAATLVLLSLAGCTVQTGVGPETSVDGGRGNDAGARFDAARDGRGRDGPPSDRGAGEDGGSGIDANDTGVDGGTDGGAPTPDVPPRPSCTDLYGGAPYFMLCAESDTECEFFVTSSVATSCNDICARFGGLCLAAYQDLGNTCAREVVDTCIALRGDELCVCSR